MKLPTRYEMEGRFWELQKRRDAKRKTADPIRAKRDKLSQKHAKEMAAANAEVRAAEKGLFEIEQEIAMLARALGNRVGEPATEK